MPDPVVPGSMTSEWLESRASDVGPEAWLLIQGFPATGFGRVHSRQLDLRLQPEGETRESIRWERYFDIRMFGDKGEWHCWRAADRNWKGRFRGVDEWPRDRRLPRTFTLWGTKDNFKYYDDWCRCSETRGTVVWVPAWAHQGDNPARLRIAEYVDFDECGIAAVTDAMILGFEKPVSPGEHK